MDEMIEQLQLTLSKDSPWRWISMLILAASVAFVAKIILRIVISRLRKIADRSRFHWDDLGVDLISELHPLVIFAWVYFLLMKSTPVSEGASKALLISVVVASSYQVGRWGLRIIGEWRGKVLDKKMIEDPSSVAALSLLYTVIQVSFVVVIVLLSLSNLGVNISALVAGLGVGGIAVALAAQNVLGDLLASLSIVLDKPFVVGDFITSGNEKGTVEYIGIKTTRLRSLSGEQLIFSNKDLLESRVQNYKRMDKRRVVHTIGVTYSTPPESLEQIPAWIKEIVERQKQLEFDRCHLSAYSASSVDFQLVYFVKSPDNNVHMDLQQVVLLDIFKKFLAEKIDFAFPSQTIYVEKLPDVRTPLARNDRPIEQ